MIICNKTILNIIKAAPIIRGSYLAQSQSDRSLCSTPATLRLSDSLTHERSTSRTSRKRPAGDDSKRETSFSCSSNSSSEENIGEGQSSHTYSDSDSGDENDEDDEDDDSIITGGLGTRLERFCWALCCACSDCCRCRDPCLNCLCCRSRAISRHESVELSGIEIGTNGGLINDNLSSLNKPYSGKCEKCVSCIIRTWKQWIRLRTYFRDTVEFAENGKTKQVYVTVQ